MSKNALKDKENEKNEELPAHLKKFENDDPRLEMDALNDYFLMRTRPELTEEQRRELIKKSAEEKKSSK